MAQPVLPELVLESQLSPDLSEQAVIPLLGGDVLSRGRQIEYGDARALFAQSRGGSHHQRRFAHLARGQRVAVLSSRQILVESGVGLSRDVAGRVAPQCSAGDVEVSLELAIGFQMDAEHSNRSCGKPWERRPSLPASQ